MNKGCTVFLFLLAVAAAVLTVIFVVRGGSAAREVGAGLFVFERDDVTKIIVTNGDQVTEFRRTDAGWQIFPEPVDRASGEYITKVLETARTTPILDRISASEIKDRDQLSQYGVKKSRLQLDFRGDGDHPLLFGKDAADETRSYVRFENVDDVYVIPDELAKLIFRPRSELRDRRLSLLRPDRIERLVIRRTGGEIEVRRTATGWEIVKPMTAPADSDAVEAFLEAMLRLKVTGFSNDGDVESVSEPDVSISFFAEGEKDPETLNLGVKSPDGSRLATYSPRYGTFRLPAEAEPLFATALDSLRDHSLARVNLDLVDRIRITSGAGSLEIARDGEEWKSKQGPVGNDKVEKLAAGLVAAKSERFQPATSQALAAAGLSPAARTLSFFSVVSENTPESPAGESEVAVLSFGSPSADGLVPVYKKGAPEIAFVSPASLAFLPAKPADLSAP